ncbi:Trans-aconitate 2-methyltransferase [Orchesella cincta]|uniref:Trans-aconitate 2-methyltransferase n=1 Tax=Orchesella cincta TaxID=48709 RepID=A0A1D2MAG8_ORCCI|nr:Trans-aconitate 2-methyltransferase [Orchesella cincta]
MACCKDAAEFFPQMMKTMRWSEGETVLDFGCGNGNSTCKYILPEVQSRNGKLYGIDRAQNHVDQAKEKYPDGNWICGDFMDESALNGIKFDKIFSMHVLNYFTDLDHIRKGLTRHLDLLKPGGQIGSVILTANTMVFQVCKSVAEKHKELLKNTAMTDWTKFEEGKGEETFTRIFEGAGFAVKDLRLLSGREFTIENLDCFLDHMLSFNPFLNEGSVVDDLKDTLKKEHRKALTDAVGAAEDANSIACKYEIVYVVAEKPEQ